jgi:hypothetical protein
MDIMRLSAIYRQYVVEQRLQDNISRNCCDLEKLVGATLKAQLIVNFSTAID